MPEEARITFYSIDSCGYYQHGEQAPDFGGNISNILEQISEWAVPQQALMNTATFPATENYLRTFCYNLLENNGRYLFITWNEIANLDGTVAAVSGNEPVGEAVVEQAEFANPDAIPGYASYFYFIPNENRFATVVFNNQLNGQQGLSRYIEGFLKFFSNHVVREPLQNGQYQYRGYVDNPENDEEAQELIVKYKTSLVSRPGKIDEIREKRLNIRKVLSQTTLNIQDNNLNRGVLDWILERIGTPNPDENRFQNTIGYKYEMEFSPSEEELESIINNWQQDNHLEKDDIGFKVQGESNKVYWLGRSLARESYELEIERINDHMIDGQTLLNQLVANEEQILRGVGL